MNGWTSARVVTLMLLLSVAFAGWQYHGYQHERALVEESLHQQSHSVMSALVGGVNSHRRLGHFFDEQLQGMLDELIKSQDVLAAAIVSENGDVAIAAGDTELLQLAAPIEPGDHWDAAGFRLVEPFRLAPSEPGGGMGFGRGYGRGQRNSGASPFAEGGDYLAILLLDRTRSDRLNSHAARSHLLMTAAGWLVIVLVALAWRASIRMLAARSQTRLLEVEAKHLRDLSQAAAGLAHETRNPLGLIRGWTQRLAQADGDGQMRREHARAVIEECDRVTARINQFLAFAKPQQTSTEPVPLEPLVSELTVLLQPDLDAKRVVLEQQLQPQCAVVRVDRELLRQALFNLIQNAIQFSPAGGTVCVASTTGRNGDCSIQVMDHGPGVERELVDSLFSPYVSTRADGTGLGLAIVKKIAGLHGWRVSYRPRAGGGSIFSLEDIHG